MATWQDGELCFGSMPNARKGADLNEEATLLVLECWTPARGLRRIERD